MIPPLCEQGEAPPQKHRQVHLGFCLSVTHRSRKSTVFDPLFPFEAISRRFDRGLTDIINTEAKTVPGSRYGTMRPRFVSERLVLKTIKWQTVAVDNRSRGFFENDRLLEGADGGEKCLIYFWALKHRRYFTWGKNGAIRTCFCGFIAELTRFQARKRGTPL